MIRSADRSAIAAMVSEGFVPTGPGMTEPSAIDSPGQSCTCPKESTTLRAGRGPWGAAERMHGDQPVQPPQRLEAYIPPRLCATRRMVRFIRSK